jgi:hypothetical protein
VAGRRYSSEPGVLIDVARTLSTARGLPAIAMLIALSLLGCVATHRPADADEAGSQHDPAMRDFRTGAMFFGSVPDANGIRRYVAASRVVPEDQESVFGILTTDVRGDPRFLATTKIPNVKGQAYGWFIWVGDSTHPVRWTQSFTLTNPSEKRSPVDREPRIFSPWHEGKVIAKDVTGVRTENTSISPDGRTAITHAKSTPVNGFIWNSWRVDPGTPPGRYKIAVLLPGGRTKTFSFAIGQPQRAHPSKRFCPYMDVYVDWWWARFTLDGDPDKSDVTERALRVFTDALMLKHGFDLVEDVEDTYWVASANAHKNIMNPEMAHGFVHMRTFADFLGGAVRPTLHKTGELIELEHLFEVPLVELDAFIRDLAETYAEKLFPHARRLCTGWTSRQVEEEARLERIRKQLIKEIERVRRERAERERRRRLELEAEELPRP